MEKEEFYQESAFILVRTILIQNERQPFLLFVGLNFFKLKIFAETVCCDVYLKLD